jgi:predicted Rossmann fold nucleotide-binding protein DprA/Smf involved in DNA uptake
MALQTSMDAIESLPIFAAARKTDPPTSHAAARRVGEFRGEHARKILQALSLGPAGQSVIAERCGLLPHQVNKRIAELARAGMILETGRVVESASGRGEREWRVA